MAESAPVMPKPSDTVSPQWFLYLVRCANGHLYTGVTTDVARRFSEHQSGGIKSAKYLRGKGPLTLMYQETVGSRGDALRREIAVKKLSRSQKLVLIESVDHSVI
ncbi:GIY-YIG nuclease family protein [Shewanella profunda]|nr:GIY-YIG nuclease family protein [Shewanella profunda]MCL1090210.1 GIY-YIG nuclease family protein [Shewanella profunda]